MITPYRLTKSHKTAVEQYLKGNVGLTNTEKRMGLTKQRIYTMVTHIMRHSCTTGRIDIKELLRDY